MLWNQLFNRAYALATQLNHYAIINDLPLMTELELAGVIGFLIQLQNS